MIRKATLADQPRVHAIRMDVRENVLSNPALVTAAEIDWYREHAIFLVCEEAGEVSGFACANHQAGLVWALFVLDPAVMGGSLGTSFGYDDLFVLAWFVASVATLGGALGTGLESDEAIRAAAYSKREEERRARLADERAEGAPRG